MSKKPDRIVYRREDGKWIDKRLDAERGRLHDTQKDAQDAARDTIQREGGGELITKGKDGTIRSKDTVAPGRDPNPPKDKEH